MVLIVVEDVLNGIEVSILNGFGLGMVVCNFIFELVLSIVDIIGVGDLVSIIIIGFNLLGLGVFVDVVLDEVVVVLFSNMVILL